jgi:hypothetical protein
MIEEDKDALLCLHLLLFIPRTAVLALTGNISICINIRSSMVKPIKGPHHKNVSKRMASKLTEYKHRPEKC